MKFNVYGESHAKFIGFTFDGAPPGLRIDISSIKKCLQRRRSNEDFNTFRVEDDKFEFINGVFDGYTTGDTINCIIYNEYNNSKDYEHLKYHFRPGHADYTSFNKYNGFNDYRGGGVFSGRITACYVILGDICRQILESKKIDMKPKAHLLKIANICDTNYYDLLEEYKVVGKYNLINPLIENEINDLLTEALNKGDTVGGTIQCVVFNVKSGLGNMKNSLEAIISKNIFLVGSVKGIEFGDIKTYGSQMKDEIYEIDEKRIYTKRNFNGGINGGISNGEEIVFNVKFKPISSLQQLQETINIKTNKIEKLNIGGRHDTFILNRVNVVIEAITYISLLEAYYESLY